MERLPEAVVVPEVTVAEKVARRRSSAEHMCTVLTEADTCGLGEVGTLLRREGLYRFHLSVWRAGTEARAARLARLVQLSC